MPKIITREYDNSTAVVSPTSNFAVVVPGYLGTPAEGSDPNEILIASNTYRVTSQANFLKYIGKHAGQAVVATAPELEIVDEELTTYLKYVLDNALTLEDFTTTYAGKVYQVIEILSADDPEFGDEYGKNGYLLRTFTTEEQGGGATTVLTYKFVLVEHAYDITWETNLAQGKFCVLNTLGNDLVSSTHIGNQIAYMLTGLGYEVLFKAMDTTTTVSQLDSATFWEPLKDRAIFQFRYIMTGGYYSAAAMSNLCALANFNNTVTLENADTYGNEAGRGDIIALCDVDETSVNKSTTYNLLTTMKTAINQITANKYSAIFAPKVTYDLAATEIAGFGDNKTFPASFHYLACAAKAFERFAEWYAVAGYTRGISAYTIKSVSIPFGEIAINTLAPRIANSYATKAVNLILSERGSYYIWSNRTAATLDERGLVYSDFLNIRQLCCTLKQVVRTACRQFTFDPNSDLLWVGFVGAVKPTLEAMKADQGVRGYTITRVVDSKKAVMVAKIRIVPIEAVEDFDISFYLENSIAGVTVTAEEE